MTERTCLLYDIERGGAEEILPQPWQTDTCIGTWHYDKGTGERNGYKKPETVIPMLADIVSKNGNLMLSIPVRSDGTIDENEKYILEGIGGWLAVNGEAIYATRPWKIYGEGPPREDTAVPLSTGEVKERKVRPLDAQDIRFTTSKDGKTLYAIVCGVPQKEILIKSLDAASGKVASVDLLGSSEMLQWTQKSRRPLDPACCQVADSVCCGLQDRAELTDLLKNCPFFIVSSLLLMSRNRSRSSLSCSITSHGQPRHHH